MENQFTDTENDFSEILEQKLSLQHKKSDLESQIANELNGYTQKAKETGKIALLVGLGTLVLYYSINAIFSGSDSISKKKKKTASIDSSNFPVVVQSNNEDSQSPIVKSIMNYITLFVLAIAKEKIVTFLADLKSNYDKNVLTKDTTGKA